MLIQRSGLLGWYHTAFFTILLDLTPDQDLPLNPNTNFKFANP